MRYIQYFVLMIGASSLGLVSGVVLSFCVVAAMTKPGSGEEWGAAIFLMFLSLCAAVFGAIVGLVCALRWIAQDEGNPWTWGTWAGVLVGGSCALAVRFSHAFDFSSLSVLDDLIQLKFGLSFFLASSACVGGLAGSWAGQYRSRKREAANPLGL